MKLVKDERIMQAIAYFENKYGKIGIKIKDYWEGDLCAIGFTDVQETLLVYFSVFGQEANHFNVHLETKVDGWLPFQDNGTFQNVSLEELESLFVKHLSL
jgi:hypothetical protein